MPAPSRLLISELVLAGLFLPSKHGGGGGGRGRLTSRMPFASGAWFPDGGHGAVRDVDRGTPLAECQWWVDWLGDEWESAGSPKVFSSHGSGYGNWEVFSPRVRTARLQGGVAQLSPEEDFRTSVEGGLPCLHMATVAAVTANRRSPGGGGVGRGAGFSPPPPANAAATSVPGLICPVPRRGCGGGGSVRGGSGGGGDASHSDPDLGSNGRCRSGDGPPPEDGLWLGRSPVLDGPSGPSGGVLLGGTRRVPGPTPIPGDSLAAAGHTVVQRRNSEDYEEALAARPASG